MKLAAAAFSEKGSRIAADVARVFGGAAYAPDKYARNGVSPFGGTLSEWTKRRFSDSDALVFVSSCGIAVRAIAPFLRGKDKDPAVVVIDELGKHAVSLLSGHVGGANELTRLIAEKTGATPVITTATDINGITAPDTWAVENDCAIENIHAVKDVAAELLRGNSVGVAVTDELQDAPYGVTLWLRPKNLFLGVGCTRGKEPSEMLEYFLDFMKESGFSYLSVGVVASVEQKKEERAILELAKYCKAKFETFGAKELAAIEGDFTPSSAAMNAVGVDNVCERSALAASRGGYMVRLKKKYGGVTFALARKRNV